MDSISDSDSEDAGSIPAGTTRTGKSDNNWFARFLFSLYLTANAAVSNIG
jgi:hypothetical protein